MSSSRKILKNALFLYFRMIVITGVALFTSRYVLQVLGVQDFGVYNLVGGFITLFSFLNSAMTTATQRYLAYDIGVGNLMNLKRTFSASLTIHLGIALVILLIGETVGLWYINNIMVYESERVFAVNVIYQFLLLTFIINIVQVPYNALITAHEKMNVFALFSFLEAILKLLIVYFLTIFNGDKLIIYAILTFIVAVVVRASYQIYCRLNFEESKFELNYDKSFYNELLSFSSWNLIGNLASILRLQGNNVLLNYFFGAAINAAYGLALQVNSSVNSFVTNLQAAFNPQIIKSFASGEKERSVNLACYASKFSFYVMLLVVVPILYNLDFLIGEWLKNIPEYTLSFLKISLIILLIDSLSGPFMTVITATGEVKYYHILIGSFMLLCLPISFVFLKNGAHPKIVFYIMATMNVLAYFMRIMFVKYLVGINLRQLFLNTMLRIGIILVIICFLFSSFDFTFSLPEWQGTITSSSVFVVLLIFLMMFIGLSKEEKLMLKKIIKTRL